MYTSSQRKEALRLYDELGSIECAIAALGYPGATCLRSWIAERDVPWERRRPGVFLSEEEKLFAVMRLESGESASSIASDIGVRPPTVHNWRRALRGKGRKMANDGMRAPVSPDDLPDDVDELKRICMGLRMENELMRRTVDIVKKGPGVDLRELSNREKTALIDAMRPMCSLSSLAERLEIPLSSYHHNHSVAARRADKYGEARRAISEEFEAVSGSRGYRCMHHRLSERGISVGERKVRQLMAEQGCEVVCARKPSKRYSSYAGEVSPAPANHPLREDGAHDFSAEAPNRLWLTDITGLKLPDDDRKVCLSPILDCFDGRLVSWAIGTRPTADLANESLLLACGTLGEGEHPVCHSDRGGHYRWPGWIGICEEHGLVRSMSRKATSPDNAAMEGFFGLLKQEFFHYRDWSCVSADEFIDRLDGWPGYYNERRIKRSLGWLSPNQYRKSLALAA